MYEIRRVQKNASSKLLRCHKINPVSATKHCRILNISYNIVGRHTCLGQCCPGTAGMPVMKSEVMNVRMTMDRWQEGMAGRRCRSRSKWTGMRTTGIWLKQL